jgi:hypothetical protein
MKQSARVYETLLIRIGSIFACQWPLLHVDHGQLAPARDEDA